MNSHGDPSSALPTVNSDCLDNLVQRAKRRLRSPGPADMAGAAIAGLALGYLLFSRRRPHGIREAFLGSLVPFAKEHAHDAYEAIAHHKNLEPLRRKMSRMRTPW
jgi:hypothetical protein